MQGLGSSSRTHSGLARCSSRGQGGWWAPALVRDGCDGMQQGCMQAAAALRPAAACLPAGLPLHPARPHPVQLAVVAVTAAHSRADVDTDGQARLQMTRVAGRAQRGMACVVFLVLLRTPPEAPGVALLRHGEQCDVQQGPRFSCPCLQRRGGERSPTAATGWRRAATAAAANLAHSRASCSAAPCRTCGAGRSDGARWRLRAGDGDEMAGVVGRWRRAPPLATC